ncbi:VOC family protein [Pacificibacter marinus]|uniref:Glyoxalase/Bleomycin resistance protein/Dioxygenase superfamily protein n=1 Tax=Pacificibacter marinus TaxID=658057 RepID=A0A1Y5TJ66_9RHOB|nr:VOC family protein [Pacificibacter marinus]SEL13775.1 Catechol 2,3-dioxygenase [Pacificibacter marinus]SLN61594.1 Glyoxalase/Bleomycin resistance protein/Dioxygenase superfamily protein [Pacificibacter marinus]
MTQVKLEHVNVTVRDWQATADWMKFVFGWDVRWHGASIHNGHSAHVGGTDSYVALYQPPKAPAGPIDCYNTIGGLNHIAVVVPDLDAVEARVKEAGFIPKSHANYEPGRRFYFEDASGIEFEVVQYD